MNNKVLIIEDDALVRDMLRKHMEKLGYGVLLASNGIEGLEMFENHKPSVVVTDLIMPSMGGVRFLQKIASEDLLSHVFIVLTAHGGDDEIETCYQLGAQSFLRKPVNLFELTVTIRQSFEQLHKNLVISQLNARFTSLMEHIPDLVWECDREDRFTYINSNVEQTLEYLPSDLVGNQISDYLMEEDLEEFHLKWKSNLSELRNIRGVTLNFKNKDGSPVPMQLSANTVFDDKGNPKGRVGICRDLRPLSHVLRGSKK